MGGKISRLSNIMLKIACMYCRRSISSCCRRRNVDQVRSQQHATSEDYTHIVDRSEVHSVFQGIALKVSVGKSNNLSIAVIEGDGLFAIFFVIFFSMTIDLVHVYQLRNLMGQLHTLLQSWWQTGSAKLRSIFLWLLKSSKRLVRLVTCKRSIRGEKKIIWKQAEGV